MLTDYETFTDEYVEYAKTVSKADPAAASEGMELMQKAVDIYEKLDNAKDNLSQEQITRMMQIQAKYLKAAQSMGQ